MSNEQLSAADALRFGAQVIELYDDATMKDDHMIDSGECAGVLLALAEYLQRGALLPAASEAEPVAWAIRYAVSADLDQVDYHGHNALADYKATYPDATAAPLYAAPVNSRIAGDGEAGAVPLMHGIMGPDGKAYFDEYCVSNVPGDLDEIVQELNGGESDGDYEVIPMYARAAPPEKKQANACLWATVHPDCAQAAPPEKQTSHSEGDAAQIARWKRDSELLGAIQDSCWDVRFQGLSNGDAGDYDIGIEIVGHYMGAPHERVLGEDYNENLRAALEQAMTADAYPPARPEYDEHGRPVKGSAPTVPHSLTVAQGDELRAALVRIRKHIGQHEIHGALKEVDAALARLSGNPGELAQGDERAAFEAAAKCLGVSRLGRDPDGDGYASPGIDSMFDGWKLARQQGGGDADGLSLEQLYEDACITANANARDAERYRTARTMPFVLDNSRIVPQRPDKFDALIDSARAQRAGNGGA